jgi:uncharacterized repeat protein (TIGR01451 family)
VLAPQLVLTKDDGQATARPGEILTYRIRMTNIGSGPATSVTVIDNLPPNTTYQGCVSVGTPGGACGMTGPGSVRFILADALQPGQSAEIAITVQVNADAQGTVVNTAVGTYQNTQGVPQSSVSAADEDAVVTPRAPAALVVSKDDGQTTATGGDLLIYSITLANHGGGAAEQVTVRDHLPPNTTYVTCDFVAPLHGSCALDASGTVVFTLADPLGAQQWGRVRVHLRIQPGTQGVLANTAEVRYFDVLGASQPLVTASDMDLLAPAPLAGMPRTGAIDPLPLLLGLLAGLGLLLGGGLRRRRQGRVHS